MSAKKKDEVSPEGILFREMLDASVGSKTEDEFADAEALFKKSREEEQERIADFSEWIENIAGQPHPEVYAEDDSAELAPVTQTETRPVEVEQNDASVELTADLDQLIAEAELDRADSHDQKEKMEIAEQ